MVPALHFCKLDARKQKSKPADIDSNNVSLLGRSPFATFFYRQTLFHKLQIGSPFVFIFRFVIGRQKTKRQQTVSRRQLCFHSWTVAQNEKAQPPTAGLRNAGNSGEIKFIAFNYLCSCGQRSAPKPRTSQARRTLAVIL